MKISRSFIFATIACWCAASAAQAGAGEPSQSQLGSRADTHVIIKRGPAFGNEEHFHLFLDGKYVSSLGYGETYNGFLPAGEHVVTIKQFPHLDSAYPFTNTRIRLKAGQTQVFTATWRNAGESAVLEESRGARPAIF